MFNFHTHYLKYLIYSSVGLNNSMTVHLNSLIHKSRQCIKSYEFCYILLILNKKKKVLDKKKLHLISCKHKKCSILYNLDLQRIKMTLNGDANFKFRTWSLLMIFFSRIFQVSALVSRFSLKDLGLASYLFCLELVPICTDLFLSQHMNIIGTFWKNFNEADSTF